MKAVAEIVAVFATVAITYWAYDTQLDGQISAVLAPTMRRLHAQARGVVGAFFDGQAVVDTARSYLRRPLPPRGRPWPDVDDR